jgi:hypothetical protein
MRNLVDRIKNYLVKPIIADGEKISEVKIRTIKPTEVRNPSHNSMRHGDRKRYFNNYNVELLNRISEIKSKNS